MMTIEQMTASESPDNAATEATGGQPAPGHTQASTPGALLRAAREAQGLSVGDVSTRMRMGVRQIEALERAEYATLPSGTFLRGMVRNYAKAVNVDADAAIKLLEETYSHASVSLKDAKIVVPSQNIKVSGGPGFFSTHRVKVLGFAAIAVLAAGAAGYWWQYIRPQLGIGNVIMRTAPAAEKSVAVAPPQVQPTNAPSATASTPVEQPATPAVAPVQVQPSTVTTPTAATPPATSPAQMVVPPPVSAAPAPATPATATVTPQPMLAESSSSSPVAESTKLKTDSSAASRPAGTSVLGFTFGGDSWLEVVDGRGRTLVSRRFASGETEEVSGRAPFSIVVGNAAEVRMAYNGKEFDLKPHTRTRTARLTLK